MRCKPRYLIGVIAAVALAGCFQDARREPVSTTTQSADAQGLVVAESPDITKGLDTSATPSAPVGPEYVIRFDTDTEALPADDATKLARNAQPQLAFVVTGVGSEPEKGTVMERRAAAFEAAIIEAIGRAVREMQRDPKTGRSPVEFQAPIAPGLTVFGQLVGGAPRTVVLLDQRGREFELCSTKGVLAHPPHDNRIIQHVFEAAGGRLVLHKTEHNVSSRSCKADVGVYVPPGSSPTTARAIATNKPVIARQAVATDGR